MQSHRQHYQDLPAIPEAEEAFAEDADEGTIDHVNDSDGDDVNGDDENVGTVDDSSKEDDSPDFEDESCASSYAFTLANVGWDEEGSLVGSVVGSVVTGPLLGISENRSTPKHGPERNSESVRNIHRETCQKFGLPYSEDWLKVDLSKISSGSSCGSDTLYKDGGSSFLGSISVSSGSADEPWEQKREQKIDKLWPWWTSPKVSKKESDPIPLDKMAKISTSPNIFANTNGGSSLVKEFWNSFNKLIEGAHEVTDSSSSTRVLHPIAQEKSKELLTTSYSTGNLSVDDSSKITNSTPMDHLSIAESAHEVQSNVQRSSTRPDDKNRSQHLVHSYRESNCTTKLRVGTVILILLLSFVIILVSVGPSNSDGDLTSMVENAGNYGPDLSISRNPKSVNNSTPGDDNIPKSANNSTPVDDTTVLSKSPTFAPSLAPVVGPPEIETAPNGVSNEEGESCVDADGRYQTSGGKKRQCEWLSQNVGLGAVYSDSLYAECGEGSELGLNCRYTCRAYNGCLLALQGSGVEGGGSGQANQGGNGSASPTFQVSYTVELLMPARMTISPTSSPTMGLLRSVDVPTVEILIEMEEALSGDSETTNSPASSPTMDLLMSPPVPSTEVPVEMEEALSGESEMTLLSAPLLLQTNTWSTTSMQHDPSTQDIMCDDYQGYYLNHNGQPRQCSWLINVSDPTDETRRIHNCGYDDSKQYSAGTDLGKMCKKTCGMCE
jgi:hypothetical protein